MAVTTHIDRIDDVGASEQGGQIVELRRKCLVDGLTSASVESLQEALDALGLESQSVLPSNNDLVLMQRDVQAINGAQATVLLTYRHFSMNEYQDLANPPAVGLVFTTEGGLQEKPTQVDNAGSAIVLQYAYAATEPEPYKSTTRSQGGEVTDRIPTKIKRLVGVLDWDSPDDVIDGILGMVNDATWFGGAARTWLCTMARESPWSRRDGTHVHKYEFQFEYNSDGWDAKAVFVHEITGKIPGDWKTNNSGTAWDVVAKRPGTDFAGYFAAYGMADAVHPEDF